MFSHDLTPARYDAELSVTTEQEAQRQEEHIELTASENCTNPAVVEARGSMLANKYAGDYPHKRYCDGCEYVDIVEQLAIDRAKRLFGADYTNVWPHTGSQVNAVVYLALLSAGDIILDMSLAHGGYLAHGASASSSGKLYNAVQYGIDANGLIDYDEIERLTVEHKPKIIVAGFSVYFQVLDFARFHTIADKVGAYLFVGMAHVTGLVAAGVYPSPVPLADVVTTTAHRTLRGPRDGLILTRVNEGIERKLSPVAFPDARDGSLEHMIATKAVCFKEALQPELRTYQQWVLKNAQSTVQILPNHSFDTVPGGTQDHLLLLSLIKQDITGRDTDATFDCAFITVDKNLIPNDPYSPFVTSGLRIGTPTVTTRDLKKAERRELVGWICDILENMGDKSVIDGIREKVKAICAKFLVYGN